MIGRLPSPGWTADTTVSSLTPSQAQLDYRDSVAGERRLMDACAALIAGGWSPWDAAAITYTNR